MATTLERRDGLAKGGKKGDMAGAGFLCGRVVKGFPVDWGVNGYSIVCPMAPHTVSAPLPLRGIRGRGNPGDSYSSRGRCGHSALLHGPRLPTISAEARVVLLDHPDCMRVWS